MADLAKIKDRVTAMLAKAMDDAATPDEAEAAMKMANKLMEKYTLTPEECRAAPTDSYGFNAWDVPYSERHGSTPHPIDKRCGVAISRFTGTRCFFRTRGETRQCTFFGLEADRELARWLRDILVQQFDEAWLRYKATQRKNRSLIALPRQRRSFSVAFCDTITDRLDDLTWRMNGGGAVDAKNALVYVKQDLIVDELKRRGLHVDNVAYAGSKLPVDHYAAGAGRNAGDAAKLSTDISNKRAGLLLTK